MKPGADDEHAVERRQELDAEIAEQKRKLASLKEQWEAEKLGVGDVAKTRMARAGRRKKATRRKPARRRTTTRKTARKKTARKKTARRARR